MAIFKEVGTGQQYLNEDAVRRAADYITRQSKKKDVTFLNATESNFETEFNVTRQFYGQDSGPEINHFIISFDEKDARKALTGDVIRVATDAAKGFLGNDYQCIIGADRRADNPHIHVMVNAVNFRTGESIYDNCTFCDRFYLAEKEAMKGIGLRLHHYRGDEKLA